MDRNRLTAALLASGQIGPRGVAKAVGVAAVGRSLDFGAGLVAPALFAVPSDAGFIDETGNYTPALGGTGNAPTAGTGPWGPAVDFTGGQHIEAALAEPGTNDVAIRVVFKKSNSVNHAVCIWGKADGLRYLGTTADDTKIYPAWRTTTGLGASPTSLMGEDAWADTWTIFRNASFVRSAINGVAPASVAWSAGSVDCGAGRFSIAGRVSDSAPKFEGSISLVAVYVGAEILSAFSTAACDALVAAEYAKLIA